MVNPKKAPMNYFLNRLKEPSTWAGIGLLVSMAGLPTTSLGLIQQVVTGAAGLYAMLAKEGKT